jgi:hypothetical protein
MGDALLGLMKVIAAAALVLVLWFVISGTSILPSALSSGPSRLPEPTPISALTPTPIPPLPTAEPTAPEIVKLNDAIATLTAAVDKLNKQLAERIRL